MQDFYTENYKTLLRKFFKDLNKWRNIPCSQLENSTLLSTLSKLIYGFNSVSKICGNEQGDSEIYTEMVRAKHCPILRTKLKALYYHVIKVYFKVTLINIVILVQE